MKWTGLNELRESFLEFFVSKGHTRLPSAPLVPQDEASLLLINSGMAPLKKYFTRQKFLPNGSFRATSCQKCIRTPDIENVGKTARHGTYFEMLGNFSFGDYFKEDATRWAWEFITEKLELPVDKLYVSVYQDDDEAYEIWTKRRGVAPDHMVRLGKEDNFWEIGSGPCGPCSEIYFDRGPEKGCGRPDCHVGCDCDRYVEFWNLVFTQFNSDGEGGYTPLEHKNIDTGMGLERLACIMQGVDNLFEVDTVQNIMKKICEIAGVTYKQDEKKDVSIRVVTDHIRSTVFMICDGVVPQNEGRGYVLRVTAACWACGSRSCIRSPIPSSMKMRPPTPSWCSAGIISSRPSGWRRSALPAPSMPVLTRSIPSWKSWRPRAKTYSPARMPSAFMIPSGSPST